MLLEMHVSLAFLFSIMYIFFYFSAPSRLHIALDGDDSPCPDEFLQLFYIYVATTRINVNVNVGLHLPLTQYLTPDSYLFLYFYFFPIFYFANSLLCTTRPVTWQIFFFFFLFISLGYMFFLMVYVALHFSAILR